MKEKRDHDEGDDVTEPVVDASLRPRCRDVTAAPSVIRVRIWPSQRGTTDPRKIQSGARSRSGENAYQALTAVLCRKGS